jgi:hypothetical protein
VCESATLLRSNRIMTIFVYLNDVRNGGRTRWRWTNHDSAIGGEHGTRFYDRPDCGNGRTAVEEGSGVEVSIEPREGLGVIHFPAMLPEVRCRRSSPPATAAATVVCGCQRCQPPLPARSDANN